MGSSSVSISANTFNGTSTYASSLQQAITHAVDIASLPVELLQNDVTDLQGQSSELSKLQSNFAAIGTALQSLTSANGGAGLGASVGDPTVATATVDSSAAIAAGTYQLKIINPGSATTTLSNVGLPTVADPTATAITSAGTLTLCPGLSIVTSKYVVGNVGDSTERRIGLVNHLEPRRPGSISGERPAEHTDLVQQQHGNDRSRRHGQFSGCGQHHRYRGSGSYGR
jgi:hypothetical protein